MRRLVLLLAVLALSIGLYGCHPHHRGPVTRLRHIMDSFYLLRSTTEWFSTLSGNLRINLYKRKRRSCENALLAS